MTAACVPKGTIEGSYYTCAKYRMVYTTEAWLFGDLANLSVLFSIQLSYFRICSLPPFFGPACSLSILGLED